MRKYLMSIMMMGFVLSPVFAFADVSFSPDLKTIGCYNINDGAVTVTGSHQAIGFSNGGHVTDFVHWNTTGSLDMTLTPDSGTLTPPQTYDTYNIYDSGWSYDHPLTNDLTLQNTPCGGGGGEETSSTTVGIALSEPFTTMDFIFVYAIMIFLMSFIAWRVMFSPFDKGNIRF